MPIGRVQMGKGPDDSFPRQTARNMRILKDVIAVIKIDELMMNRLSKDRPDDCGEKNANPEDHPAVVPASAFPRDDLGLRFCLHSISGGHDHARETAAEQILCTGCPFGPTPRRR